MKKAKKFDCVEIKWEIQKKIASKTRSMSDSRVYSVKKTIIKNDPVLGKFLENSAFKSTNEKQAILH